MSLTTINIWIPKVLYSSTYENTQAITWFDKSLAIDSNYEESLMHKQSMLELEKEKTWQETCNT